MNAHIFMCVHVHIYIENVHMCIHKQREKETERQKVSKKELNDKFMSIEHFQHINFNTGY